MTWADLDSEFRRLKQLRRSAPADSLDTAGKLGHKAISLLAIEFSSSPIRFTGGGGKSYSVFSLPGTAVRFSRPVNDALLISDPTEFADLWTDVCNASKVCAGTLALSLDADVIDRVVYSAVIGFGCLTSLYGQGGQGAPGTFLEMIVGPLVSQLIGRMETSSISIPIPETGQTETVQTDLSFVDPSDSVVLVIPTKISTRERISQAFVHQRILETARPLGKRHRSVLVIANENNVMAPPGTAPASRTIAVCYVQDTLVPGTIVMYQKYVAELSGLYYLDAPARYIAGNIPGFPPVGNFGKLLTNDLPALLRDDLRT